MTIKLSSLAADLAREEKGDWIDYPDWPGVAFNVSSLNLPAFTVARDILLQRLNRVYHRKIPQQVQTVEVGKLMATHLLHNWRGLDVPYSPEVAMTTLSSPEYRDVTAAVQYCAAMVSQVEFEVLPDDLGNSGKPGAPA